MAEPVPGVAVLRVYLSVYINDLRSLLFDY